MDIIFLRDLEVDAVIGIYAWEKAIRQKLVFNLEMAADIRAAAASDSIDDTLNYKAVAKRVIAYVEESRFELVETLAENVARLILEEFSVPWVRLELNKGGAVRQAKGVGIRIERGEPV
ncbi:MAG: dihydroneopterin aldolase [Chromatiales bacterium]|nr:dihydroneopterin aldolase [Chromatiales bacterium]